MACEAPVCRRVVDSALVVPDHAFVVGVTEEISFFALEAHVGVPAQSLTGRVRVHNAAVVVHEVPVSASSTLVAVRVILETVGHRVFVAVITVKVVLRGASEALVLVWSSHGALGFESQDTF
jgi:hypothetical protein